jgi:hypothetical protein
MVRTDNRRMARFLPKRSDAMAPGITVLSRPYQSIAGPERMSNGAPSDVQAYAAQ